MSTTESTVNDLLKKMSNLDKDFRYMAVNDLILLLNKEDFKVSPRTEGLMVDTILELLKDRNSEVQKLTIDCLKPLVNAISDGEKERIVEILCSNLSAKEQQLRDSSIVGVKLAILSLPPRSDTSSNLLTQLSKNLLSTAENNDGPIQFEALNLIAELFKRYGPVLSSVHESSIDVLIKNLTNRKEANRKPAINAIGELAPFLVLSQLDRIMRYMINKLETVKTEDSNPYFQLVRAIMKTSGHRMGAYVGIIFPLLRKHLDQCVDEELDGKFDEIIESCLTAIGSCVETGHQSSQFLDETIDIGIKYISYDPDFVDDESSEEEYSDMSEDESDADFDDENDDDSHKIRKKGANLLECAINASETLSEMTNSFKRTASVLQGRIKKKDDDVKITIFDTFISLLKMTSKSAALSSDTTSMDSDDQPMRLLQQSEPSIVADVIAQCKNNNNEIQIKCLEVLRVLISTLRGGLSEDSFSSVLKTADAALKSNTTGKTIVIEILSLVNACAHFHDSSFLKSNVEIVPTVCQCCTHSFYKISAQALDVIASLIPKLHTEEDIVKKVPISDDYTKTIIDPLYHAVFNRFQAVDLDQEVKDCSIRAMAKLVSHFGNQLPGDINDILSIFESRCQNEISSFSAVSGLYNIISSPLQIDVSCRFDSLVDILTERLFKDNTALNLESYKCLLKLLEGSDQKLSEKKIETLMEASEIHIKPKDGQVTSVCLELLTVIMRKYPEAAILMAPTHFNGCFKAMKELIVSPIFLQGCTRAHLLRFLEALVQSPACPFNFELIFNELTSSIYNPSSISRVSSNGLSMTKDSFSSIAKTTAVLALHNEGQLKEFVEKLVKDVEDSIIFAKKNPNAKQMDLLRNHNVCLLAMLCLGELGSQIYLNHGRLPTLLEEGFQHPVEDVKMGAAFSLGLIVCGNLNVQLEAIVNKIKIAPVDQQYMWLHVLFAVLNHCLGSGLLGKTQEHDQKREFLCSHISVIYQCLLESDLGDEGKRNVIADCFGNLIMLNYDTSFLMEKLESSSGDEKAVLVTAVKYCINYDGCDILKLKDAIVKALYLVNDPDINVRRISLITFNSVAHTRREIFMEHLPALFPLVLKETIINESLIKKYNIVNDVVTEDAGLDTRMAAYECMYTLLASAKGGLNDFDSAVKHTINGLSDDADIQILSLLILIQLVQVAPNSIRIGIDPISAALMKCIMTKKKKNHMEHDILKIDSLISSALRAVLVIQSIQDIDQSESFAKILSAVEANAELKKKFDSITSESL